MGGDTSEYVSQLGQRASARDGHAGEHDLPIYLTNYLRLYVLYGVGPYAIDHCDR